MSTERSVYNVAFLFELTTATACVTAQSEREAIRNAIDVISFETRIPKRILRDAVDCTVQILDR